MRTTTSAWRHLTHIYRSVAGPEDVDTFRLNDGPVLADIRAKRFTMRNSTERVMAKKGSK